MAYAWIIDTDHLAEPGENPGVIATNAATVVGPVDAPADLLARLAGKDGREFRMFDDDRVLYYTGRIIVTDELGADEEGSGEDFGPLDDLGMPNAGCTSIKYRNKLGEWKTL